MRTGEDVSGDDERQQPQSSQQLAPEVARRQLVRKRANLRFDSRRLHQSSSGNRRNQVDSTMSPRPSAGRGLSSRRIAASSALDSGACSAGSSSGPDGPPAPESRGPAPPSGFKSAAHAQRFLSVHGIVRNLVGEGPSPATGCSPPAVRNPFIPGVEPRDGYLLITTRAAIERDRHARSSST